MNKLLALSSLLLLSVACQEKSPPPSMPAHRPSVFEVVVSDLVKKEAINSKFVGSKVMVFSGWNEGDSLFYDPGDELKISDELIKALEAAPESKDPFPPIEVLGPNAVLTSERPLNYLEYYSDEVKPVQAKCFVSFWRPGYSKDRKRAIVRATYGPESHSAVATYLLEDTESGWRIKSSILSMYP